MEGYFAVGLIGILIGFYLGNKKFRQRISNMIASFKGDEDEDYD